MLIIYNKYLIIFELYICMDKTIKHIDGNIGGYLVGRRHSEGGIKAINKSTNQPLEMEGGEVVITRNAVSDNEKREFEGEMLTNKQILSRINEGGGGVSFEKGGEIHSYGNKYNYGGHLMTDHEILHTMAVGGEINELEDFDFENEEYALGGTLTSGLELIDLEGGAFIQSGNNYPPMKVINYNSFPIYVFGDYREKKQKTLKNPLKLTYEPDGLIKVYQYQKNSANLQDWVVIDNVDNISKIYQYLDSKYVNSSAIVVCNYEFLATKSSLQRKILNLLNEFSRYDEKRTSTRKGINKAIEVMDDYQNSYLIQRTDDFKNTKIKRVYFTQDIDWTKNSAIPNTQFDVSSTIECFLIMHNRKQILNMLSRVKASLTGKKHWNFFVIEFEDGRMRFDVLSLKQNQSPINFDDIINTNTPRNEETVTILTNSQYVDNSIAPDFIIQDSELADKQIKELPTIFSISLSTNNQTFKVGDAVKYIGTDMLSIKNGDIGKIIRIPNQDQYDVEFKNGSSAYLEEIDLKLAPQNTQSNQQSTQFKIGDRVEYLTDNNQNIKEGTIGVVTRIGNYSVVDVDFDLGNNQIKTYSVADSELGIINFKVGDNVEFIGNSVGNIENGDKGVVTKVGWTTTKVDFNVLINGQYEIRNYNVVSKDIAKLTSPTPMTPKFKVGEQVRKLDQSPSLIYEIMTDELSDNKWVYELRDKNSGIGWNQVRETNLVLADESTRYNNEFNIGDIVQVVFDMEDAFGNIGTITKVETMAINGNRVENPSKKLYTVDYNIVYGKLAKKTIQVGNWEGKDLQLISSSTTNQGTTPNQLTPMTPSTNAGARIKLTIGEQDLQNQINDLTDLLNLTPEYDFEDRIAISQELTTLQQQMNVYVADSTIQNEFYNTGKISKDQSVIDLMLSADCVKLSPRPTNTNIYQNGFNPNGKPTALNKFNYDLIHTEQFQRWFGNYGLSYNYSKIGESNLGLSSQVVNSDGEPLVVYMGVGREFEKITFARFPIGYFAVNEAYAEWFATTKADDGVGYVLPFFLNIRKPLDFSMFGIDEVSPKDFFDWLYLETGMTGKELGFDDRYFLPNCPSLEVWRYIRFTPNFLNKLKEYKICDGIHFYENNPSNPVNANNYMTEVWTIFYSNQCKLASQSRSEMILSANNSFLMKKGGLVK